MPVLHGGVGLRQGPSGEALGEPVWVGCCAHHGTALRPSQELCFAGTPRPAPFIKKAQRRPPDPIAAFVWAQGPAGKLPDHEVSGGGSGWARFLVGIRGHQNSAFLAPTGLAQVKSGFTPQMARKPNTQNRAPLMFLSGQPALKVRLAATANGTGMNGRGS